MLFAVMKNWETVNNTDIKIKSLGFRVKITYKRLEVDQLKLIQADIMLIRLSSCLEIFLCNKENRGFSGKKKQKPTSSFSADEEEVLLGSAGNLASSV